MLDEFYKRLKKGSLESFALQIIGVACLFFMHSRMANVLSVEDYGVFNYALAMATMLVLLSTVGWPGALTRLIPEYVRKEQWMLLKGMLISSHFYTLFLSILFSFALVVLSLNVMHPEKVEAVVIAAVLLPLLSLIALRRRIFMALHSVRGFIVPDEIILPIVVAIGLFLLPPASTKEASYLYIGVALLVFLGTLLWLRKLLPGEIMQVTPAYSIKKWLSLSFPFMISGGAQMFLNQSGVLVLGYYNKLDGVGLYSAAFRLSLLVTFVMSAINVIGMPLLATAFQSEEPQTLKKIFRKTQLWSIFGAFPVGMAFFLFSDNLLKIFGDGYVQAAGILQVLIVGQMANAASGLSGSLLAVSNKQIYFASTMALCAVTAVIMMAICIPIWGVTSVAIIYSMCMIALSGMQYYGVIKVINGIPDAARQIIN